MAHNGAGEVVVVTGASAGLGRAIVRAFARTGARIGLLARDRGRLETALREVEELGGLGMVVPTDVADPDQVEEAAARVEEEFGPVDIWVNNAMVTVLAEFWDMTPAEFRRVTEVTYLGYVYGSMAALKRMVPRDHGTVVQVGSALAERSIPLQAAYCGAKHAIRGFTDSIRCELIHDKSNVHITMVQMPAMNTPQFDWCQSHLPKRPQPVPPIYQPELAAEAVVWAAHNRRRELWVGGSTVQAMLGNRVAPGLLDHYLAKKAYGGQQTDEPADPDRPSNLWETVPGDYGSHGAFDSRARTGSPELWMARNRRWIGAGLAVGAAALTAWALTRSGNGTSPRRADRSVQATEAHQML